MARNAVKVTPYSIFYKYDDGDEYIAYFDTKEELFYEASRYYAFDDYDTGVEIIDILCDDKFCHYAGWRPGMRIIFKSDENEVLWDQSYPEWDH